MKKRIEIFENYPIPKAVWSLALPTMIGMLITVIYNLADTFFVGKLGDVNQIAAVSVTMPIFLMLMAFGAIFGVGAGTYISRMLGRKEYEKVKQASSFSFYAALALGIVCTILSLIFMKKILYLSGASENTYEYAKSYLTVIALFSPAVILSFSLGQLVRAEGAAKEAMQGMMIGTILNIILDPIFILYLKLGVRGAAIATIIANIVSIVYYCIFITKKNSMISIHPKYMSFDKSMLKSIFSIGIPASLNTILMSLSNVALNNYAAQYSDSVLGSIGVVNRILMLPALLLIGLSQGVQPLIGYTFSAGNFERMKKTLNYTLISGIIIGTVAFILFYLFGENAVKAFIADEEVIRLGAKFIRIMIISLPVLAILFTISFAFQAFGESIPSLILSISRQGMIFLPVLVIFNKTFGLDGLVFAQPIADIGSIFLAIILFLRSVKKHEVSSKTA